MRKLFLIFWFTLIGLNLKAYAQEEIPIQKHFGPVISEFVISVPTDFQNDKCIDFYAEKAKEIKSVNFYCQNVLNSGHFSRVTDRLQPCKMYKVKIFPIVMKTTVEDCITFIKIQNGLLVGAPGIILIQDLSRNEFPIGKYTISVDAKNMLWKEGDCVKIPYIYRVSNSSWWIGMYCFDDIYGMEGNDCLLCVVPQ